MGQLQNGSRRKRAELIRFRPLPTQPACRSGSRVRRGAQEACRSGALPLKGIVHEDESWIELTFPVSPRRTYPWKAARHTGKKMRTIQEDFREFAHLDRKRTGDGVSPREYRRWLLLRHRLDKAFTSGPPEGEKERRVSLRVPTRLHVSYDRLAGLEGVLRNLSRTGCFIRTDLPAPVGTRLDLVLRADSMHEVLELHAEVVTIDMRHDGSTVGERGMGLRFLDLSPETRKKLDTFYAGLEAAA